MAQITIRLTAASKAEFNAYSADLGLGASKAAKLLIERERRLERLAALARRGAMPARTRQPTGKASKLPTITAHLPSTKDVRDFDNYVKRCGLNRNAAGAWILETELNERWLARQILSGR